jgi:hypothetical protein
MLRGLRREALTHDRSSGRPGRAERVAEPTRSPGVRRQAGWTCAGIRLALKRTASESHARRPHDRHHPDMEQRNVLAALAVLIVGLVVGVTVALLASGQSPPSRVAGERAVDGPTATGSATGEAIADPSASPVSTGSASPRPGPPGSSGTAGSTGLTETFDMLPTGGDVPDWTVRGDGSLDVVPIPTAVRRSARFVTSGDGTACRALPPGTTSLTAVFMIDPLPADRVAALSLTTDDSVVAALFIAVDGVALAQDADPVAFDEGVWHRWLVQWHDGDLAVALAVDEAELAASEGPLDGASPTAFCLGGEPPSEIHLDMLTVEGN